MIVLPNILTTLPVWTPRKPAAEPAPAPTPEVKAVVTGVDPVESENVTYDRPIPVSALGKSRIGTAGIVYGPKKDSGTGTWAASFGVPADPSGTRKIYELAFDSKVAWADPAGWDGTGSPSSSGFTGEAFTFRFYQGTLTQSVDPLETADYGLEAVAYRPQMVVFIEELPLAQFGNKIPYVAAVIGDTTDGADPEDGIPLGDALTRFALSPWVGMSSGDFETSGITDAVGGMIVADNNGSFLDLLQLLGRAYLNLDVIQTDKLKVVDRGPPTTPDIIITPDHIIDDSPPLVYSVDPPSSLPRTFVFKTIDPDADFVFVPSQAQRPRDPVNVSASVGQEVTVLPLIMDATTRQALVTYSRYAAETARKRVNLKTTAFGLEIEPGDRVQLSELGAGYDDEIFRVIDTLHGDDYSVELTLESILNCQLEYTPPVPVSGAKYENYTSIAAQVFTDVDIGSEATDRLVIIVTGGHTNNRTITGITLDGNPMTIHENVHGSSAPFADPALAIASLVVPTGDTCDIVVTYNAVLAGSFLAVFTLTGYVSATPYDSVAVSSPGGADPVATINIPSGGTVIAAYIAVYPTVPSMLTAVSWDGLSTVNFNEAGPGQQWYSVASQASMSAETGREISVTGPSMNLELLVAASWS